MIGEITWNSSGNVRETSYQDLRDVFETERLWMLADRKDMALLLQKMDLISGTAETFLPFLREKIESAD